MSENIDKFIKLVRRVHDLTAINLTKETTSDLITYAMCELGEYAEAAGVKNGIFGFLHKKGEGSDEDKREAVDVFICALAILKAADVGESELLSVM